MKKKINSRSKAAGKRKTSKPRASVRAKARVKAAARKVVSRPNRKPSKPQPRRKIASARVAQKKPVKPVVSKSLVRTVALKTAAKPLAFSPSVKPMPLKAPVKPVASSLPKATRARAGTRRAPHVTRVSTSTAAPHRHVVRMARMSTFAYMNAPLIAEAFDVGDTVEVFCDHERSGERVRGWIKGIVVQVDNKLVAVQFRSNVFLTDGWMVPDRILWYSLTSDQIRPATFAKKGSRKAIPDY